VIRIDVHPAGETRPTHHTYPTIGPRMLPDHAYLMWSTRSNLSLSPHEVKTCPYTGRNLGYRRQTGLAIASVSSSVLPHDRLSVGERCFSQVVTQLYRFTGTIYQHAIGMFNTYLRGSIHRSLTDTSGGYNHIRAPPDLRLSNHNIASRKNVI
jgi:hypothetical protein